MVPTGIADLVVVFLVLGALMVASPVLRFGWWHLLGGAGNVLLGQTNYSGVWWRVAKFALPLALLLVIPILAHGEEVAFRLGVESKSLLNRVRRLVVFGLMHPLTAGIPLAAGLARIISGAYFERVYLVAIRRLEPEIEAAGQLPSFERLPHPDPPDGPDYDPVAFARYRQAAKAVSEENQRRLNAWRDELPMQAEAAARDSPKYACGP